MSFTLKNYVSRKRFCYPCNAATYLQMRQFHGSTHPVNHYVTLGLSKQASDKDIRDAYVKVCFVCVFLFFLFFFFEYVHLCVLCMKGQM